jgi:hypothetical protein
MRYPEYLMDLNSIWDLFEPSSILANYFCDKTADPVGEKWLYTPDNKPYIGYLFSSIRGGEFLIISDGQGELRLAMMIDNSGVLYFVQVPKERKNAMFKLISECDKEPEINTSNPKILGKIRTPQSTGTWFATGNPSSITYGDSSNTIFIGTG